MSWQTLARFGAGLLAGFANEGGRGYDFEGHMRALASACGLDGEIDNDAAALSLPLDGRQYVITLVPVGSKIAINLNSTVKFPLRQVPEFMCVALSNMNKKMARADYDLMHGHRHSYFYIKCGVDRDRLTPDVFIGAVKEMMPYVLELDEYLHRHGYD